MINVLCLYLVNICLIFFYFLYVIQISYGKTDTRFWTRQRQTKEAWSTPLHLHRTHFQYACIHQSRGWLLRPSLSTYLGVCYDTQSWVSQLLASIFILVTSFSTSIPNCRRRGPQSVCFYAFSQSAQLVGWPGLLIHPFTRLHELASGVQI